MKELFALGYEMGRRGDPWSRAPPESDKTIAGR
jgi:hypothetical protein